MRKKQEVSILPMLENLESELHDDNSNAPTQEVGHGKTYVIMSFRDPDVGNCLCHEIIF